MYTNLITEYMKDFYKSASQLKGIKSGNDELNLLALEMLDVPEKPEGYDGDFYQGNQQEVCLLVSGGLDSTMLYFLAKSQGLTPRCFYVNIGQPYAEKELKTLRKLGISYEYINLSEEMKDIDSSERKHILPGRNMLFLSEVALRMKGGEIRFGVIEGEMKEKMGGDKSRIFLEKARNLLLQLPYPVDIKTPIVQMTKGEIVKRFIDNDLERELDLTVSCYNEEEGHCGECQACFRKAVAYAVNSRMLKTKEPVKNHAKFFNKYIPLMTDCINNKDFSVYSERRCREDLMGMTTLIASNPIYSIQI